METGKQRSIGLIGIGLLGSSIASRLLQAGHSVVAFDLCEDRRVWLKQQQGAPADNAANVFEQTNEIILSLPTSLDVAELIGSLEISAFPGRLVLDTTTGSPGDARNLGERLALLGVEYLDATILGSSADLVGGQAIIMAGGTEQGFSRAIPIMDLLVKKNFHVGRWGAGSKMKLVVNLVLGLNRAVLAEGLSFASRLGFDLQTSLDILSSGVTYSRVMDTKGQRMLAREFTPQARLRQHHKDVRLILEQASDCDIPLPLSELHERLLSRCIEAGWGDLDNSAIIKYWENSES